MITTTTTTTAAATNIATTASTTDCNKNICVTGAHSETSYTCRTADTSGAKASKHITPSYRAYKGHHGKSAVQLRSAHIRAPQNRSELKNPG